MKNNWKVLLVIFAVALAVRVFVAIAYDTVPNQRDMANMIQLARDGGFSQNDPPLYPVFLRIVFALAGGSNYTAVYVIQGLISAFTALLMFGIVARVCNKTAGIIAAALFAS